MKKRYKAARAFLSSQLTVQPASALRASLKKGYGKKELTADLMAGAVVGVVALPLAMALAIASGVAPQHGLYTAIIGGASIALLGGSKVQVSGPTAAFVVILAPISARYGLAGLLLATLMAGLLLITFGLLRGGKLIEFIPYPVTTGFTSGIAVVIATIQLKDFFGLTLEKPPEHYLERLDALMAAAPTARWQELSVGLFTIGILIGFPKLTKKVPAPLVGLAAAGIVATALSKLWPDFQVATIASRFTYTVDGAIRHGIPPFPPLPTLPWLLPGASGHSEPLTFALLRTLLPSAFAIAMLGAIESLLCAVVADGMSGNKHNPDTELIAQGVGNVLSPFFGGIAATGAIARTATNIRAGAKTPFAAFFHAVFILLAVMVLAPVLGYLPMASLAALLLVVAYNMSEARHFIHILRVAPKSDVAVLLVCFGLTVIFDMTISVATGVMLAAVLFMRRMADTSNSRLLTSEHHTVKDKVPKGTLLYEIRGPLFFGAAQKAISKIADVSDPGRAVIIDMTSVPAMDVTGLVALESIIAQLRKKQSVIYFAGLQDQPFHAMRRAGISTKAGELYLFQEFSDALAELKKSMPATPEATAPGAPAAT